MADEELTPTQIYFVLGSRNPSDEDLNKVKDFLEKEAGKDDSPWKDGISNEFMALTYPKYNSSVELGKLSSYECDNITSVIKNLQTIGATETLKHFLNDNNSPNGHSAVTYLALHAMVAQNKIDSGKLDDTDKDAMEFFMNEQLKTLQTLADLTDENGEHIVNFASLASNNRNLKDMAQIYNASIARRYEANGQPILQPARNLDQFFARVDADEQKYQTNIGGNEEARPQQPAPQEEQLPENVANVGKETKKDKNPSRPPKEYKSRDIKPKDVIDFFYEDIFLHYLNLWTDKLIGYIRNGVDRYADWCKQSGDELDRATEKMKNADCKAAAQKIGAEYNRVQAVRDAFTETRADRRTYMVNLNKAIKRNLIEPVAGAPENWEPLNINNPSDKQMIESLKRSSQAAKDAGSNKFEKTFTALEIKSNQDMMLEWQEMAHDMGYMLALTDWKHKCLNDKNLECLKINDLSEDKDFQAKVLSYAQVVEAGVAAAMAIDMSNNDTTYTSVANFLKNLENHALDLEKKLDKDIKAENFKANPDKKHRPKASNEAYKEFAEFVDDTIKFASSVHILPHHPVYEARSVKQEAAAQIYEIEHNPHSKEEILVNASLATTEAALQANQQRGYNFQKLKEKLFGSKDNKFYQLITTNMGGGRSL